MLVLTAHWDKCSSVCCDHKCSIRVKPHSLRSAWLLGPCSSALSPGVCQNQSSAGSLAARALCAAAATAVVPAGSTSSSLCEHWVSRLPGSKQPSVASAASSRRTSLASLSESVELAGERSEDDGVYRSGGLPVFLMQGPY